jgi:hypothetical protein
MDIVEKAIETQGTIDKDHRLILDETLPVEGPQRVRVIILVPEKQMASVSDYEQIPSRMLGKVLGSLSRAEIYADAR